MPKKVLIIEIDIDDTAGSWCVALQRADFEVRDRIDKHVIIRAKPDCALINIPHDFSEGFVTSVREEKRES
jgi:hypothetical protein